MVHIKSLVYGKQWITVTDLKSCIGGYKTVQITGKCPV